MRGVGDELALDAPEQPPIRSVISLNERASERCSEEPSTLAVVSKSPPATRRAATSRRRTGLAIWPATTAAAVSPIRSTSTPMSTRPTVARFSDRLTAATSCVMRTAPSGRPVRSTGTAVASTSVSSVAL